MCDMTPSPGTSNPEQSGTEPFYSHSYVNQLPSANKLGRLVWGVCWHLGFRISPTPLFGFRRLILRLFGARIGAGAHVYPSTRIWAPWNLVMEHGSCLGPEVYCYNVAPVHLGVDSTASFRTFLCTASHDIRHPQRPLITAPIRLDRGAYVFADAFVGMNVTVGEGAVVAARAVVVKDVAPYDIVGGNPARVIGRRDLG